MAAKQKLVKKPVKKVVKKADLKKPASNIIKRNRIPKESKDVKLTKELAAAIEELYPEMPKTHLMFFASYIEHECNGRAAYQAIKPGVSDSVAAVTASKMLKDIPVIELLDLMGLGLDSVREALVTLKENDPAKFLKYQSKLRKWDTTKVELSGQVDMPIINIVTTKED